MVLNCCVCGSKMVEANVMQVCIKLTDEGGIHEELLLLLVPKGGTRKPPETSIKEPKTHTIFLHTKSPTIFEV